MKPKLVDLKQRFLLQSNGDYVRALMGIAAKKDRKYLGLVHMDYRGKLTPYHAYAMVRLAFEAELLDPRDFKKSSSIIPARIGQHDLPFDTGCHIILTVGT